MSAPRAYFHFSLNSQGGGWRCRGSRVTAAHCAIFRLRVTPRESAPDFSTALILGAGAAIAAPPRYCRPVPSPIAD